MLVKVQQLKKVEMELAARKAALARVEREWEQAKGTMDKYKQAQKALDLKMHEVGLLEERVQESNATRVRIRLIVVRDIPPLLIRFAR